MRHFLSHLLLSCLIILGVSCGEDNDPESDVTITSISPGKGVAGSQVTITGTGFSTATVENVVRFGNLESAIVSASATELVVIIPGAAKSGATTVTVTVRSRTASYFNFIIQQVPLVTDAPEYGEIGSTVQFEVKYASNVVAENEVLVNGEPAEITEIYKYKAGDDPEFRYRFTVKVPVVESGAVVLKYDGLEVTITENLELSPYPQDFNPKGGVAGATITITGLNFKTNIADNTVVIGGRTSTVTSASKTQLTVLVGGPTSEFGQVIVNGTAAPGFFSGTALPSLFPVSGPVGTSVLLYNVVPGPQEAVIKFNGVVATEVDFSTGITAKVPAGATSGPVTLQLNGFTSVAKSNFTVE